MVYKNILYLKFPYSLRPVHGTPITLSCRLFLKTGMLVTIETVQCSKYIPRCGVRYYHNGKAEDSQIVTW